MGTTMKQKVALTKMVGNGGNVTRAMIDAGYSPATANTPSKLTKSTGFQDLLKKHGFTQDYVLRKLKSDIDKKPKKRFLELNLAAEITGLKKQDKAGDTNVVINILNFNGNNAAA